MDLTAGKPDVQLGITRGSTTGPRALQTRKRWLPYSSRCLEWSLRLLEYIIGRSVLNAYLGTMINAAAKMHEICNAGVGPTSPLLGRAGGLGRTAEKVAYDNNSDVARRDPAVQPESVLGLEDLQNDGHEPSEAAAESPR